LGEFDPGCRGAMLALDLRHQPQPRVDPLVVRQCLRFGVSAEGRRKAFGQKHGEVAQPARLLVHDAMPVLCAQERRRGRCIGNHAVDRAATRNQHVLTGPQAGAADVQQHLAVLADGVDMSRAPLHQPEHAARRIARAQQVLARAEPPRYGQLRDARLQGRRQRSEPAATAQDLDLGSVGRHGQ
jgi:hypothetical protein